MKVQGQVAMVTGAARGIGRAIACGLAREGASVVACDVRGGADAESLIHEVEDAGGMVRFVEADVARLEEHERLVNFAVENFQRLNILVNNAGVEIRQPFLEVKAADWEHITSVNLRGAYFLAQAVARRIIEQCSGGKIINITSIHDTVALRNASVYSISKGGMMMMTRSLALELAEHNIRVNAIAPGAILTDMNRTVLSDPAYRERVRDKIPLRRIGGAEDIAGAAIYLASDDSSYMTGATLYIDGGLILQ